MIYTIGDSHCRFGWADIDGVKVIHLGPKLMHSFSKRYNELINLNQLKNLEEDSILIFCFGEIDCRNHIHKYSAKKGPERVIELLTKSYINSIKEIRSILPDSFSFGVYMVPPPSRAEEERYHNRNNVNYQNPFPFLGTDEERKGYHEYVNKCLGKLCDENNLIFINPYEKYCDSNGFLSKELADQDSFIHIKNEKFIKEELKLKGLI